MREPLPDGSVAGWVSVWDPVVRLFHWALVALIAIEFVTDGLKWIHEPVGYAILALVAGRLVWGALGSRHARFANFVRGPRSVVSYLSALRRGRAPRYLGHNPAGGVMIVLLVVTVLVVAISGWLSETDAYFGVDWVSTLHSAAADVLLLLIGVHVLGVIVTSLAHRENLVSAMITGRKPAGPAADADVPPGKRSALTGAGVVR